MRFERMRAFLQPESQSGGIGHYPTDTMLNYILTGIIQILLHMILLHIRDSIKFCLSSVPDLNWVLNPAQDPMQPLTPTLHYVLSGY